MFETLAEALDLAAELLREISLQAVATATGEEFLTLRNVGRLAGWITYGKMNPEQ